MVKTERLKWGICFAVTGAFIAAGMITTGVARRANAAEAQLGQRGAQSDGGGSTAPAAAGGSGQQIFDRVCGRCHPNGNEDIGPRIVGKNFDQPRMTKQIRNGSGRMRAINTTKLPDANLPALMAYLQTIHAVR